MIVSLRAKLNHSAQLWVVLTPMRVMGLVCALHARTMDEKEARLLGLTSFTHSVACSYLRATSLPVSSADYGQVAVFDHTPLSLPLPSGLTLLHQAVPIHFTAIFCEAKP